MEKAMNEDARKRMRNQVGISSIVCSGLSYLGCLAAPMWENQYNQHHNFAELLFCIFFSGLAAISFMLAVIQTYRYFFWNDPNRKF